MAIYQNDKIVVMEDKEDPGFVSVYKDNCKIATAEADHLNWCVGDLSFVYIGSEKCRKNENDKLADGLPLHEINSPDRKCIRSCYFWSGPDWPIIMGRKEVGERTVWSTINGEFIEAMIYLEDNLWTFEVTKDIYDSSVPKLQAKFEGQCPESVTFFDDNGLTHASPCVDSTNWLGGRFFQNKTRPQYYYKNCPFMNIDDLWLRLSKDKTATWTTENGNALKRHGATLLWTLFDSNGKIIGQTKDLPAEYPQTVNSWYQFEEISDQYIETPVMFDKFPKCAESEPDENVLAGHPWLIIAVGCLSILSLTLLILLATYSTRKIRWRFGISSQYFRGLLPSNLNEKFSDALVDKYVKIEHLQNDAETILGQGHYGKVTLGILCVPGPDGELKKTQVAVKSLHETCCEGKGMNCPSVYELLMEAGLMCTFEHEHVLSIHAISINKTYHPIIILPFCENGTLEAHVKSDVPLSLLKALEILINCADGFDYLAQRSIIHRDIALRNILLDARFRPKITDFGLAKYSEKEFQTAYYTAETKRALPVENRSPEVLTDLQFSTYSDIWAFGILVWQTITRGSAPYNVSGLEEIREKVAVRKQIPYRPELLNGHDYLNMIWHTITECWSYERKRRKNFKYYANMLVQIRKGVASVDYLQNIHLVLDSRTDQPGSENQRNGVPLDVVVNTGYSANLQASQETEATELFNNDYQTSSLTANFGYAG